MFSLKIVRSPFDDAQGERTIPCARLACGPFRTVSRPYAAFRAD
jgi:hypothetical protein